MNLEHFQKQAEQKYLNKMYVFSIIKSDKRVLKLYLTYLQEVSDYLKKQLLWGHLRFEFIEHETVGNVKYTQHVIRYTRQIYDNILNLNHPLLYELVKKKKWKKTKINITSAIIALMVFSVAVFNELKAFYLEWFPDFHEYAPFYNQMLKLALEMTLKESPCFRKYDTSVFLSHVLADMCSHYNLFF